jgi:hypothetical protein
MRAMAAALLLVLAPAAQGQAPPGYRFIGCSSVHYVNRDIFEGFEDIKESFIPPKEVKPFKPFALGLGSCAVRQAINLSGSSMLSCHWDRESVEKANSLYDIFLPELRDCLAGWMEERLPPVSLNQSKIMREHRFTGAGPFAGIVWNIKLLNFDIGGGARRVEIRIDVSRD